MLVQYTNECEITIMKLHFVYRYMHVQINLACINVNNNRTTRIKIKCTRYLKLLVVVDDKIWVWWGCGNWFWYVYHDKYRYMCHSMLPEVHAAVEAVEEHEDVESSEGYVERRFCAHGRKLMQC